MIDGDDFFQIEPAAHVFRNFEKITRDHTEPSSAGASGDSDATILVVTNDDILIYAPNGLLSNLFSVLEIVNLLKSVRGGWPTLSHLLRWRMCVIGRYHWSTLILRNWVGGWRTF